MAKKKSGSASPETPKSTSKKVKKAPLSNTAIRFAGFLIAFIGIMLIITKGAVISTILQISSVFAILWGLFLVSGSIKKLFGNVEDKNRYYLNMFIGFVLIIIGVLFIVFGGQITPWFIIVAGALIGVYGLMMMIKFICAPTNSKTTFNIVMSIFTLIVGILICLLYVDAIKSASNGVCYIIFGSLATAVGCLEIVCY